MKKLIALIVILALFALAGCETFNGLGKDLQKAGDWVEDQADQAAKNGK